MALTDIFKRKDKEEETLKTEEVVEESKSEEAAPVEEEAKTEETEQPKEEEEEAKQEDSSIADAIKAEYEAKLKELEEAKAAIEAEKAEAIKRAEEAEKNLADQKAAEAIAKAVAEGRLTPSQVGDGSVFVRLAHENPDLFAEIVEQLNVSEFPVKAKLSQDEVEKLNQPKQTIKDLVAAGTDPMRAFDEVTK